MVTIETSVWSLYVANNLVMILFRLRDAVDRAIREKQCGCKKGR